MPQRPNPKTGTMYDPVRHRLVVFGGVDAYGNRTADTWVLSLGAVPAWSRLATSGGPPAARILHSAIYDPAGDRMIILGGLVRAWRDLPTLRDPDRFDAWLHRLLVRACIDQARRVRRHRLDVELTHMPSTMAARSVFSITA